MWMTSSRATPVLSLISPTKHQITWVEEEKGTALSMEFAIFQDGQTQIHCHDLPPCFVTDKGDLPLPLRDPRARGMLAVLAVVSGEALIQEGVVGLCGLLLE